MNPGYIRILVLLSLIFGSLIINELSNYQDLGFSVFIGIIGGLVMSSNKEWLTDANGALICIIIGLVLAPVTYLYISSFNVTPSNSYLADRGYYLSIVLMIAGSLRFVIGMVYEKYY